MGNEIFALEIENEALRCWVDEKYLYEFKTRIKYKSCDHPLNFS
jgi:hypothetical protein